MKHITPIRIVIAGLFALAAVLFLWMQIRRPFERWIASHAVSGRVTTSIDVAPATLAGRTTILAGPEGLDADGYPTQHVDKLVLRSYLLGARYADLTTAFEQLQDAAEKDDRHEYGIADAADSFGGIDTVTKKRLDAWVKASPDSFAPYLTRGAYLASVVFKREGAAWRRSSEPDVLTALSKAFAPANADLDHAIALRPKLVAALRLQLRIAAAISPRRRVQDIVDEATRLCPECFQVRADYLVRSAPRWGGSLLEMETYVKPLLKSGNPRLRLLPGYVDLAKAQIAIDAKDDAGALAAIERACALGDDADFFVIRGGIHGDMNDWVLAEADFDRAVALRPEVPFFLAMRANAKREVHAFEPAGVDLLEALRIDPSDDMAGWVYESVVPGIRNTASQAHERGNDADALRLYDLGLQLAPRDRDFAARRAGILAIDADASVLDASN